MPQKTFADLGVDPRLVDALAKQTITHPFPIQELTLPMALKGADVIGQARTGTGKTLAFGLSALQRVDAGQRRTQALVVVPTRELCLQVTEDLAIGAVLGLEILAVYGGVPIEPQTDALRSGVQVVVGTPGRLLDHLGRGNLDLSGVTVLVLDEADEMLDMGFLPDVERLIEACSDERHTMLFSATMQTAIVKLARRYMSHPTFLRAESDAPEVAPTVSQHFFLVHRMDKPRVLARILQSPGRGGVYVFCRTKSMCDRLVRELEDLGVAAIAIHGDLRQAMREKNMDRFREGKADVLVATEVAARGLDVDDVSHVVNYDCPDDEKMYLHRIGRTARAGADGVAITFAQFNEVDRLNVIRKAVDAADNEVEEVFSTSDRLTELFDLPEQTPWGHFATKGGSGQRSGSSSKSSSGRGSSGRDSSSKGSSGRGGSGRGGSGRDGSSKGSSGRGGSGRDSSRKGRDEERSERSSDRGGSSDRGSSRRKDTSDGDDGGHQTRERQTQRAPAANQDDASDSGASRTRTRQRTRASADESTSSSPDRASPDRASSDRASADRSSSSDDASTKRSSGRVRARGGLPTGRGTADADSRTSSDDSSGDSSGSSRSSDRSRSSRSGSRAKRSSSSDDSSGNGRSRNSSRSSGRDGSSSRSRRSSAGETTADAPTSAGPEARGEGQPRLARRVEVEHLP